MKKIVSLIVSVILTISLLRLSYVVNADGGNCGKNVNWSFEDGIITIYGKGEMMETTSIGQQYAYSNYKPSVSKVVIDDGVTLVGKCAFWRFENISEVVFGDTVETIGDQAFYSCKNITELDLNNIVSLNGISFWGCENLTSVIMNDTIKSIGTSAFGNCPNITDVYYCGSESQWKEIEILQGNECLTNATIHYNYKPEKSSKFDYQTSDWAIEEIEEADEEGLIPEELRDEDLTQKVTRAEFAAIAVLLYENLSGEKADDTQNPFTDIDNSIWKSNILKAYNLDITTGVTNTLFDPDANITREQLATMLTRTYKTSEFDGWTIESDANYPLNFMGVQKFSDHDEISEYARESVYFLVRWDVIQGVGDNKFAPKNNVELGNAYGYATREQAIILALRSKKHL